MKNRSLFLISIFFVIGVGTGCQRSTDDVWNDTKTAGRHMGRGVGALGGKQGTSRQITDGVEFGDNAPMALTKGRNEFIPFGGEDQGDLFAVGDAEVIPAPKDTPGDIGSSIPGIEGFRDPALDPELAPIFEHIHFDYNAALIKGDENLRIVHNIATYLKSHPNVYVFVEGHCDKRGSAAYNFALGANRANAVRTELIQEGISPDRLFTTSYGKEKPLFEEDGEEFHRLNRRVQFKVYER